MSLRAARMLAAALPLLLAAGPRAAAGAEDKTAAAVQAGTAWLALVDGGKYAESWSEASEIFRGSVPEARWVELAGATRKPLGKLLARKLTSKTYSTSLPGAPDGEYVVVQYASSFTDKKAAVETVSLMKEKDGRWKVAGYFVR